MTTHEMLKIVQEQLAVDMNCRPADFNREKDSFVFVQAKDNPGRRPFRRGKQFFEMVTFGQSIVVSATPERLQFAKEQFAGKLRDEAFAAPFICGHVLCFLPDLHRLQHNVGPRHFRYETVTKEKIAALRELQGFPNAVQYDEAHPVQNTLAVLAKTEDTVAGIASASRWSERMWGIGIDVLPPYQKQGLGAYLVNALTHAVLRQDIVPVYSTVSSNIASQRTGYKAGYLPAWMSDYRLQFEGELRN